MQSRSYLFLLIVLVLGVVSGLGYYYKAPQYGLDIRGGVRLTYSFNPNDLTEVQRDSIQTVRQNIQRTLVNRSTGSLGVTEPIVQAKGENSFVVELPGFTDEGPAIKTLSTTASVLWYDARTISSSGSPNRTYARGAEIEHNGGPAVTIVRRTTGEEYMPGTPEYARAIESWGEPILRGDDLKRAYWQPNIGRDTYMPTMEFNPDGARALERWSRRHTEDGQHLAAVLDGVVISMAPLERGAILSDQAVISGDHSIEYVRELSELLNSGSLPVTLKLESSQKVDPTIGQQALDKIIFAGVISFGLIAAFLIVYYAFPGFIALIALGLYVLFTLTVMKWINATFSLAAIAGFILSVGMAVDANILVFERFKEEMKAGKSLKTAIELGFGRALPAIIDSNACTILTSLVLAQLGTGPVKGFATTLIIGVAISLFTAITVTRSLLVFFIGSGIASNPKWYAVERNWFGEKFEDRAEKNPFEIVNKPKKWFVLSVLSIVIFLPFWFIGGLKPSVEFRGGYEVELQAAGKSAGEIVSSLDRAGIEGANVKFGGSGNNRVAIVTVPLETGQGSQTDTAQVAERVAQATGLQRAEAGGSAFVGPSIQAETVRNAILGVVLSAGLIILYLAFRFGVAVGDFRIGLRFGFSAILALAHDVLVVLGITAVFGYFAGWEVSTLFLTSMLTVIGFSVHDTIVIFDRIRENLRKPLPGEDFAHLVNRSITQSFARSINTSMTVIATLLILFFLGTTTPDLKLFCVTMLAGILSGTYSSIYNASPILYLWDRAAAKKKGEKATIVAVAQQQLTHEQILAQPVEVENQQGNKDQTGRSYGQVRRRASAVQKSRIEIDE